MTILNSADLRNNLADVLKTLARKKEPVLIGRFGQPQAVMMDIYTYNWQQQVMKMLRKINKLTSSEIETLNILLDDKARNALFSGLEEMKRGEVISLSDFLSDKNV
ncbi:type II toxin-antitoxin system Phd/YefM family antitoxin [Candidatus Microgenomates bacterium]|nr:type II toxin-antitoxin system Phd/YefM family antitoxin [Candidatus Microgenomates bacterium]